MAARRLVAMETVGVSTLEPGAQAPQEQDGRRVGVKVQMLDEQMESFLLEPGAAGKVLFDLVCLHLNLTEGDYFGLEYQDHRKITVWLDLLKPVFKQIRRPKHTVLRFVVKFFPPDHSQLMEELTRYLFALQVKRDLASGLLVCNDSSAALMVSHIIQSEIGDFDETQTWQHLLHNKYLPDQDELRGAITERHRQLAGQTPAESDYQLLDVARRLEMYGVRLHPAKDREGSRLSLAVCHAGVLVLQGYTRINAFNWSKIRKLSFKRKRFLVKLRSDPASSAHHDTLEFAMASRDRCKAFWKACVEHHAFFRLLEEPRPRRRRRRVVLLSRGSSFRFSGRTQKQIMDFVRDAELKKVPFERKHSKVVSHSSPSPPMTSRSHDAQVSVSVVSSDHPDSSCQPDVDAPGYGEAEAPPTNGFHADGAVEAPPLLNADRPAAPRPTAVVEGDASVVDGGAPVVNGDASVVDGDTSGVRGDVLLQSPEKLLLTPLTSPLLTEAGYVKNEEEEERRRRKFPADKSYFMAKELLNTERTFIKDLELVTKCFPAAPATDASLPDGVQKLLRRHYEPLLLLHRRLLRDTEQRLAQWEGRSNAKGEHQRIGDVLLSNIQALKQLTVHLQKLPECLVELERACCSSRRAEAACGELERQRACYLPLSAFLLRPLQRLLHYRLLLERLCKHYAPTHGDFRDCRAALADISELVLQLQASLMKMENFQKLLELKRDLSGVDSLLAPGREFIRLGCLSKLTGKGLQQRMVFLFSDSLIYTSRGVTSSNQFRVHGQLQLYGVTVRESEDQWGVPHSFTLYGHKQTVVLAASCASEMELWLDDLRMAVDLVQQSSGSSSDLLCSSSTCSSDREASEEGGAEQESEEELCGWRRSSLERQGHRGNSIAHVCWHRNTSVSMVDFSIAVENQLSGNLLRKFKNSNGWQKLWVVFTNFSLFFYKSHQDDYPLASLPLLGYLVTVPTEAENIQKDHVFKLHFKSHVYYFRSESEYSFDRWMEVIRSTTCCSTRRRELY